MSTSGQVSISIPHGQIWDKWKIPPVLLYFLCAAADLCQSIQYTWLCTQSTVQYSTAIQYSTVQQLTCVSPVVQYSTVQCSTLQYSTVQYSTECRVVNRKAKCSCKPGWNAWGWSPIGVCRKEEGKRSFQPFNVCNFQVNIDNILS